MNRSLSAFLSVLAGLVAVPSVSNAYDLKPIVVQLRPSGAAAAQQMTITNSHAEPIAIEVKAYRREQMPDGTDKLTPEDENLIISPPQMVIAPQSSQAFKVRWIGEGDPTSELAFRIVTTQLPIKFKTEKNGEVSANLNLTYKYEAALYVIPPGSAPDASISTAVPITDEQGKDWLELVIKNRGNARALIDQPSITLRSDAGGVERTLSGNDLMSLQNLNILAGSERRVRLPWPTDLPKTSLTASLNTKYTVLQ